jgi:hypothetical protein
MTRSGRRRGRPTTPRREGTASTSGINCVTSLRLPPVRVTARGRPLASTRRWRLEPDLPRSTGLGPVAAPPFGLHVARIGDRPRPLDLACGSQPVSATARAAAPRRRPSATRQVFASTSSQNRNRARAEDGGCLIGRRCVESCSCCTPGSRGGNDRGSGRAASASARLAPPAPTTRLTRPTAQRPSASLPA